MKPFARMLADSISYPLHCLTENLDEISLTDYFAKSCEARDKVAGGEGGKAADSTL